MGLTVSKQVHPANNDSGVIHSKQSSQYAEIDRYVSELQVALSVDSVESLAAILTRTTRDPLIKVRAFYKWITKMLRVTRYVCGKDITRSLEDKGAWFDISDSKECAELFSQLCRSVDISAKVIGGFFRTTQCRPEDPFYKGTESDHFWNVVQINGDWRIVDCVCGAAHPETSEDDNLLSNFYFFTNPEMFIVNHFPFFKDDPVKGINWQLLKSPRSLESFDKSLCLSERALLWGLKVLAPNENCIVVKETVDILIEDSKESLEELFVEMRTITGEVLDRCAFVKRVKKSLFISTVKPPTIGNFSLKLFGRDSIYSRPSLIACYMVKCTKSIDVTHPFPFHRGIWGVQKRAVNFGFIENYGIQTNFESHTGELDIFLQTDRMNDVSVRMVGCNNEDKTFDDFAHAKATNKSVAIKVRFPCKDTYKLELYCKHQQSDLFFKVLVFLIQCTKVVAPSEPFPKELDRVWV